MGDCSEACSKVTVPLTLESPRRTATAWFDVDQCLYQVIWRGKVGAESRQGSGTCGMACFKHDEERECLGVTGKMSWFVHAIKVLKLAQVGACS